MPQEVVGNVWTVAGCHTLGEVLLASDAWNPGLLPCPGHTTGSNPAPKANRERDSLQKWLQVVSVSRMWM